MNTPKFRLSHRGALLLMISAAFTNYAFASTAGRVDFVAGDASLRSEGGQERPLTRGAEVASGDTLITRNGRAQIRFTDGAFVSLQPNTEFGVREYRYEGKADGNERGFFALLRGAMRTVTGAIGRTNRNAYQVRTPTATVGIRGTGGLIHVLQDDSTLIRGSSGTWILGNDAGQIDVPAGTAGIATPDPKEPPRPTDQQPSAPPPPPTADPTFRQSDETTAAGEACVVTATCDSLGTPMVSGPGYHVSFAFGHPLQSVIAGTSQTVDATFNAAGQLTSWTEASGAVQSFSGTHMEGGSVAGVVAWGRWIGTTSGGRSGPVTFEPNEGFHYVVGLPTATMPVVGTVPFALVGATSPTGSDGTISPGTLASGNMLVTFGQFVDVSLNPTFGSWGYSTTMRAALSPGSPFMSGSGGVSPTGINAPLQYSCGSSCSASFQGAFFCAGASCAGVAYQVNAADATVSGVAFFHQ
jgi:hypothetical protein